MPAARRQALFWQVYATLLASLALVALLGAALWHAFAEEPMRAGMTMRGQVISALMPPASAPGAQTAAALGRLSLATRGEVDLIGADCRLIQAAWRGRRLGSSTGPWPGCPRGIGRQGRRPGSRIDLADGRALVFGPPVRATAPGLHILAMLLLSAAAVGVAAWPVVVLITRRLVRLRQSVEAWGEGQFDRRAVVDGADEIAAVAAAFNVAADRAAALLAAHRSLLAHASHELRSPLARLRIAMELFMAAPHPDLIAAVNRDIAELDALVEEILLASRLDHGPTAELNETVDCLALAAEEAARSGVALRVIGAALGAFQVSGSPRLLRRMVRNLIENAQKHGAPPVEVEVGEVAAPAAPEIAITVYDHGPGIAPPLRERVFEPFFRPDGRGEEAGSWGLGLSLARQIARRHGGEVTCGATPDGVTAFVVRLPATRS